MKNAFLCSICAVFALHFAANSQTAPVMGGTASSFTLFTSAGALINNGASTVTGNVGTNVGEFTGFDASVLFGLPHIANPTSVVAAVEVSATYASFPVACDATLPSTFGLGSTLVAGVYCTTDAAVLSGDLILDAESNPSAMFIIKVNGALATDVSSRIVLTNGALATNVYFQVNGAFALGSLSKFSGNVVAGGAIEFLEGASLNGRAMTTAGAITLNNNVVSGFEKPLPVKLASFNAKGLESRVVALSWTTTEETNSDRFEIERSRDGKGWVLLGNVAARGDSKAHSVYSFTDENPSNGLNLYRLKMIDLDLTFAYSRVRSVELKTENKVLWYPNPVADKLIIAADDMSQISIIQISDLSGKLVYNKTKKDNLDLPGKFDVSAFPAGIYVTKITNSEGAVSVFKIIKL